MDEAPFDMSRAIMEVDATGDETLWVFRYANYFCSATGWSLPEAIPEANAAYEEFGNDPDYTPEEIASSDIACLRESGE